MEPEEIDALLARTLEDGRLSRHERQALAGDTSPVSGVDRMVLIERAFVVARDKVVDPDGRAVLDWLGGVVASALRTEGAAVREVTAEAYFSPGEDCRRAIRRLLAGAKRTADVCVFTITDDRLSDAVLDAQRRGVAVRVITDDSKAEDLGSDVGRLAGQGVAVRVDRSPFHMHHKFAVLDGEVLLTGSYNWTRGAAAENEENVVVTGDPRLVSPFVKAFDRLWAKLGS